MEAIRLPYVKLTNISQVTSKAAATTQINNNQKKFKVDKNSDRLGLSSPPSKEFVIIKRILLSKKCLQKSYSQTQTHQSMMSISNYVLLFGVDQELTHFLINDCDGKIPVRFGKSEKHQSEVSVNNHTKDEFSERSFDEESSLKIRKLATNTTTSQQNCKKCLRERIAKLKSSVKKCKKMSERLKKNHKIKAPQHKEHHETELPMAQAVKLLSRGVISVCKPSLDCDVPKEIDTKRSQQDADRNIIEIIDDLSSLSGSSVIINEHNQTPIMVESEDDETRGFPKNGTKYSINKSTMTEDYPTPIPALEQINNKPPLFKEIKNKTPDKLPQRCSIKPVNYIIEDSDLTENKANKISTHAKTDFKKDDEEIITITASDGRAQINSNFLGIFKEKSKTQNQTDTDPDTMAITEERLNRLNNEEAFLNINKVTSRNSATIDENLHLQSINIDDQSVDSTVLSDTNLHRNIVETSPTVDIKCIPSDEEEISKQMVELIECQSTSEITSSSDQNQCNIVTMTQSVSCTAVQQMLLKDLQLMVQKFHEFSHSEKHARKIATALSTESTVVSKVDDRKSELLPISAKSSDNLTDEYSSTEADKVTPAYFDTTDCATQISEDKLTPDNDYSIKDIDKCNNINSASQSYQITSRNKISKHFRRKKIQTMKKAVKAKQKSTKICINKKNSFTCQKKDINEKNEKKNEKKIAIHAKRKTIGAPISENDLPRKPRVEKETIDSANHPVSTVEDDNNISNCDEMTNNESDLFEPSTESAKLEDIVKNGADPLEKLNPATKPNIEDETNNNKSSEVTISNITRAENTKKGMCEEIKQILVFIDKNILIVDPVEGVSINPNTSQTAYDGSHLNTSNLVSSEKQTVAMIQSESDKAFNKTSDHLTMNKNDTDSALPNKVKNGTVSRKRIQPQRRVTQNKDKNVNIIQKSPIIKKCISTKRESTFQLKQLRVVCERFSVEISKNDTKKNNSTVQEEHCDSTTVVIENRPEVSSPLETCHSRETVTCNTDPEYFKSYPLFYPESTEDERQINSDWRSKIPLKTDGVEADINNIIDNEISIVNNEIICVEDSTTKDSDEKNLNSDYSIAEVHEEVQTISGALLSSPPHHKSSHLPITAAPTVQKTATRIAQPLREPNEEIVFRSKLPNSTNLEYEKLIVDVILNTENSVGVENQEEYSVVQCIPKNNSQVTEGDLVETISDTSCKFNFKPISIGSPFELTSDVILDTQLVNLSSVDDGANSKTLSNTKYSDSETVSSTTLSNGNDLEKTIQLENTDREKQFNMVSNSTIIDISPHSELTLGVNSNSNYCGVDCRDLVIEEHSAKHDLVKTQPDNEATRGTATIYKTNSAETSLSSRNITASEYILRKQEKSEYIELNTAIPDPRLQGSYLCFEEAVMLSDVNKVEIFKNISAKQANLVKKKFKKRDDKDLQKLEYKKDENNLDNALKLQTAVTDHQMLCQHKKEKVLPKLISISDKTPESSLHVLSSSPHRIDPVLDAFSDGALKMCPPPSTNPQLLASSRLFSPVKSLESLSSSLLHSFNLVFNQNVAQESQSSKINDYSKSESSSGMNISESPTTNAHSSPLSITEKAMADQLELKSKVESRLKLEKPFPKGLTVSLRSNDTVRRHSDQPSPGVSMKNVVNNQIPPCPAITDSITKMQEDTIHDAQKLRLKDIRRPPKQGSEREREEHTLLSAIQKTQIQVYSNPYYIESNPEAQKIEVLAARQDTTKRTDQQCFGSNVTRSQRLWQNLKKDIATQREGLDLSKSYENAVDGESDRNSYITGNNYRSQKEFQSDKSVNQNTNTNYKHYYRKKFNLLPDVNINLPPPNQINQPSDIQRRQANCSLQESQATRDPNYINPMHPSVPATQQYYGSSIYPVCPTPITATNNIHITPHNNHFVDNRVLHGNPNNRDQYSPCNPMSNYQHGSTNLQSTQCSQRQVTNLHHFNPNSALSTQSTRAAHSAHSTYSTHPTDLGHSQIRFPPPQGNIGPNMFARSFSPWINPIHPYPPQEHRTFPPLDAQKQQFIQNYAKRARPPPPQAQPKKIPRRRSSMFQ